MASDLKWIEGVTDDTPAVEAARLSFSERLRTVDETWSAAIELPSDDDRIHDMRVATRRANATITVFGDFLSRRTREKLDQLLHKLRRAAGDARDQDVYAQLLCERAEELGENEQPAFDWLAGSAAALEARSHAAVRKTANLRDKWQKVVAAVHPKSSARNETLADRADAVIAKRLAAFHVAAQERIEKPSRLHRLRIAGKRLRYSLELLGPALSGADHLLHAIHQAQDILGAAHDARTIADRLENELALLEDCSEAEHLRYREGIQAWKNDLEREANEGPAQFREWQREWKILLSATGFARDSTPDEN